MDIQVPADGVTQAIELKDGSRLFGRVEKIEDDAISFRTLAGREFELRRDEIVELKVVHGDWMDGEFRIQDPNQTRLFFGPTGRSLPRGKGYVGVYEILMPFVQVGVTDRITVGGGTPLFFGGGSDQVFWFTPKVQVYNGRVVQASVGWMHFLGGGVEGTGVAYGVATMGTPDSAVTVGGGYAYGSGSRSNGTGVLMLGADHRVSRGVKLITENYLWEGETGGGWYRPRRSGAEGFVSGGVRFFGERLSADLGLVKPFGGDFDDSLFFPIVNFVWTF